MATAKKQAEGQPSNVMEAAKRVGEVLFELHASRETALWRDV